MGEGRESDAVIGFVPGFDRVVDHFDTFVKRDECTLHGVYRHPPNHLPVPAEGGCTRREFVRQAGCAHESVVGIHRDAERQVGEQSDRMLLD